MKAPSTTASDFDSIRPRSAWARPGRALLTSLLLLAVAALGGSSSTAQATVLHSFHSYMGGLSEPEEIAVDQTTGDLYVVEHASNCVSRFYGERGGPQALMPHDFPATGTNKVCGFKFREGEIYGEGSARAQVAIDNSGTATEGYFYVNSPGKDRAPEGGRGPGVTLGFDSEGHLVTELREFGPLDEYSSLRWACGVTTDGDGNVYVTEFYGPVQKYTHDVPVGEDDLETQLPRMGANCSIFFDNQGVLRGYRFAGTVDHTTGDIYFTEGPAVVGTKANGTVFEEFADPEITQARGVAFDDSTGMVYVADSLNDRIALFDGTPGYQVGVNLGGTGLGAVSAATGPIKDCGDEGECSGYYTPTTVALKATPQPHSTIQNWNGCDAVSPAGDECTVDVTNADREVDATFSRVQRPIVASTAGTGTGSVSSSNGQGAIQGCGDGGACTGPYDEGSAVELVATPVGHSSFVGWSGACTNETGPCEVVVEGNPTVTAHFTAQHAISVKKAGTGAGSVVSDPNGVDCGGVCVAYFTDGESVTLSAISSGHSTFTGWAGQGCSGTATCQVEIGDSTKTITASFAHDPPAAETGPNAAFVGQHVATVNGSVNPNGAKVTRCVIEYGTDLFYGAESPCAPSAVGNGDAPVPIGVNLTDLQAGQIYHFRLSASSIGGTVYGADQTFRTLDDTCDTKKALCPAEVAPLAETQPRTCKSGFVLRKGRCVKKKGRHKKARIRRRGSRR